MDTEYILDSATELAEITPLESTVLYAFEDAYSAVRQIVDHNQRLPEHFLQNTARHSLGNKSMPVCYWAALRSLQTAQYATRFISSRAAYLIQSKIQRDLGIKQGNLLPGLIDAGTRQAFEDRLVKEDADITETVARQILERHMGDFRRRLAEDVALMEEAAAWYQQDGGKGYWAVNGKMFRMREDFARQKDQQLSALIQRTGIGREGVKARSQARSAIKKVTKLFTRFGQTDNLRLFVSGHEVELSHPDSPFKFVLRPLGEPGWLISRSVKGQSHTPYDLSLLTKDDVFISRLCVYFDETPVLDQLLALTLFVQSGDELELLKKANFFSFGGYDEGKEQLLARYPELESKYPKPKVAGDVDVPKLTLFDFGLSREDEHWEPFKGRVDAWVQTWFEPVFALMLADNRPQGLLAA